MTLFKWGKYSKYIKKKYRLDKFETFKTSYNYISGGYPDYTFNPDTGEIAVAGKFGLYKKYFFYPIDERHNRLGAVLMEYNLEHVRGNIDHTNIDRGHSFYYKPVQYDAEELRGTRLGTVTSTNRNAYPNDGVSEDFWYVYEGIENQDPIISGADAFIGNKSSNFRIDYMVTDDDLNDIVKVEIQEDNREPKVISAIKLGVKNYLDINVADYELGDHIITIKATDSKGAIATRIYRWTKINNAPLISGSDKDLGEKNTAFTLTYQVSDADNDIVNVVEKINGKVIRNLNNASKNTDLYLNITQEQILEFEIGKTNTIEIEATDTKGGVSYRRYTFKKTNLPPIISGNDRDLGVVDKLLSYSYSVTDTEDDDIYVDVVIDEIYLQKDLKVEAGKTYKVEIKGLDFLKLKPGKHTLKIMATDKKSDKVVRLINFTRDPKRLVVMSAKPIETDAAAKKFYFNPVWKIAVGAEGKIEICNNGFDKNPTWEDATSTVKVCKTFNFTNQTKKASKWGIAVKMTINKNKATAISYIATAGGAFE